MHGNSILIQISDHKYIYVGNIIYEFATDEKIIDYVSPVGNSDVPYPVAIGSDNVYFMLDKQFIKSQDLETPITVANAENLYSEFYGHIGSKKGKYNKYDFKDVKLKQDRDISGTWLAVWYNATENIRNSSKN